MPRAESTPQGSTAFREFSLYRFVAAEVERRGTTTRALGRIDDVLEPTQPGTFDASVRAMQYWCRLNESLVLERRYDRARVYAGFERISRVRPVVGRYRRLARQVQQLTLFAELDAPVPIAVTAIDVAGTPLAREWFLVIDAPAYSALLVARDQHGFGPTGPLTGRRFVGVSTHDADLVQAAVTELEQRARTS